MSDDVQAALERVQRALEPFASPFVVAPARAALSTIRQALRERGKVIQELNADIEVMTETLMEAQGRIEKLEAALRRVSEADMLGKAQGVALDALLDRQALSTEEKT